MNMVIELRSNISQETSHGYLTGCRSIKLSGYKIYAKNTFDSKLGIYIIKREDRLIIENIHNIIISFNKFFLKRRSYCL